MEWCFLDKNRIIAVIALVFALAMGALSYCLRDSAKTPLEEVLDVPSIIEDIEEEIIPEEEIKEEPPVTESKSELDIRLDEILENYGNTPLDIYNFVHDNHTYKLVPELSLEENALYLLENGTGSCFNFAALTYKLFERAGYDVRYITGLGWQTHTYHCWIAAKFDGAWYYVDSLYINSAKLTASDIERIGYLWDETNPPKAIISPTGALIENADLKGKEAEDFELPLVNATGFASYPTPLFEEMNITSNVIKTLTAGESFCILEEVGEFWHVETDNGVEGFVEHKLCFLNIADVIPSIVIENTNSTSSVLVSSGEKIEGITGEKLYDATFYSERFGKDTPVLAANYTMVKKIYKAQEKALLDGFTLVINETFRPLDVQLKISEKLSVLREQNEKVRGNIDKAPWGMHWFIASKVSTHQLGCAMDTSLARVEKMSYELCGEYLYKKVISTSPCTMPTPIHELSSLAVSLKTPVNSSSKTDWQTVGFADSMTEDSIRLFTYCTDAGMTPLASEWWHFNDLDAKELIGNTYMSKAFYLGKPFSKIPS